LWRIFAFWRGGIRCDEVSGGQKALENGAGSVLHLWRTAADTLGCNDLGLTG
jgi:hypothetical protein